MRAAGWSVGRRVKCSAANSLTGTEFSRIIASLPSSDRRLDHTHSMTEPLRTNPPRAGHDDAEREARIEQLLLAGLDQYFAGRYEQAVDIWTRVAFLERGHGRARAYIERARRALAERQRESEELLHTGVAAYHAGDLASARDLLTRAVAEGGPNETALVFLQHLGRLEAAAQPNGAEPLTRASLPPQPGRPPAAATGWIATTLASVVVAAAILVFAVPVASWLAELPAAAPAAVTVAPAEPLPIVRPSELRIARARELFTAGRPHDALRVLAEIDAADPLRADADRVRADVQRELLASMPPQSLDGERPQ